MSSNSADNEKRNGILCIGEYGRLIDLSKSKPLVDLVIKGFSSNNSEVKQAASIAFGNIIVGNPQHFLSDLFTMIKGAAGNQQVNFVRTILEVVKHAPKVLAAYMSKGLLDLLSSQA